MATIPESYGIDIACGDEGIDPHFGLAEELDCLKQSIIHRLDCLRTTVLHDTTFGLDLSGALSEGLSVKQLLQVQGQIVRELQNDARVNLVTVKIQNTQSEPGRFRVDIRVTPTNTKNPFDFVLSVGPDVLEVV